MKILIIINIFLILYICTCMNKNVEKMSDVNISSDIINAVNQIYDADLESIRNLGEIAKQLQDGGLEIKGNVTITGNLNVDNKIKSKDLQVTNRLDSDNYTYTKRLDISAKRGITHFNYNNTGQLYIRDDIHDHSTRDVRSQVAGNYIDNNHRVIIRSDMNDGNQRRNLQHDPGKGSHENARFENNNRYEWEWMRIFKI